MATAEEEREVFLRARQRTLPSLPEEQEWKAPFYFIQGADPQFGLMKAYAIGDCDSGGDEWEEELKLTQQAVQAINQLNPKPKFFVLCGDLVHGMPGTPWREAQIHDLKNVLKDINPEIPLVFVSGNHDLGNTPTPETIQSYCKQWGDDYFSFWIGGIFFLVLNSQLYFDSSKCLELKHAQDAWLSQQLAIAEERKCKHAIVFQHIPLFLREPSEDHNYFNLELSIRHELLEKFHKAVTRSFKRLKCSHPGEYKQIKESRCIYGKGVNTVKVSPLQLSLLSLRLSCVKAVFSGHYHKNAGGLYKDLDMVVSSAIGCQLGEDTHGLRLVAVTAEKIFHRYYSLNELNNSEEIEKDFMTLMKEN